MKRCERMMQVESNSTMSDFAEALANLLDEYKVEMTINKDVEIRFESKAFDFAFSTTEYSFRTFENVAVELFLGNYEPRTK